MALAGEHRPARPVGRLACSASNITRACDGGTTRSSSPCRSSSGRSIPSTWWIGERSSYVARAAGHGPIEPVEVARLELVRLLGEQRQVGDAEEADAGAEGVVEGERREDDEAAGRPTADAEPRPSTTARSSARWRGAGDAVLDVGDAPGAAQPLAVGAPVARRARVVHVEDREPARGEEADRVRGTGDRRRGGPAVRGDDQRRELAVGDADVGMRAAGRGSRGPSPRRDPGQLTGSGVRGVRRVGCCAPGLDDRELDPPVSPIDRPSRSRAR